jgi:hypothetical protein
MKNFAYHFPPLWTYAYPALDGQYGNLEPYGAAVYLIFNTRTSRSHQGIVEAHCSLRACEDRCSVL